MTAVWKGVDPNEAEARLRAMNRRLLDLDAALEGQRSCLRAKPGSFAFRLGFESLLGMQERLATERNELLAFRVAEKIDVALDGGAFHSNTAGIATLGVLLIRLQGLYSSIAQSLAKGPRRRGPIGRKINAMTELRLASTFPSSFGMSLVVEAESERQLIENTLPSNALDQLFGLLHNANDPRAIRRLSGELGARPINHLRHLAGILGRSGSELRLEWSDSAGLKHYWAADAERARSAFEHLGALKEVRSETRTVRGRLVGASLLKNTFELLAEDEGAITGKMATSVLGSVAPNFGEVCLAVIDETEIRDALSEETSVYRSLIDLQRAREV
jgi:hypothetical protein